MKERICILILVSCILSGMAMAAPSFLGTTGLIFIPNDRHLQAGDFSANFHSIDYDRGATETILGANVGLTEELEVGVARISFNRDGVGDDSETILNGKYSVLDETASRPSLLVGVLDAGGNLDEDDPGLYVLIGKNLTPALSGVSGSPVSPIRGYVGLGTGALDGLFGGIEWSFNSKATLLAEFLTRNDSEFNFGARFAISGGVRGDIALIDGDDLGFGISYTKLGL